MYLILLSKKFKLCYVYANCFWNSEINRNIIASSIRATQCPNNVFDAVWYIIKNIARLLKNEL